MSDTKNAIPVPTPADRNSLVDQFTAYYEIVKILRAECPWDKKQTNATIAPLILEEAHEMLAAVHSGDDNDLAKELGDVLLHIVMHSIIAEERGAFNLIDVLEKNSQKLVHRHPHVFGEVRVEGEEDVLQNWEALKMQEGQKSILSGVPKAMPALLRAERIQHKAARVGFDWDNEADVWAKVVEEMNELQVELESGTPEKAEEEFGDFLFALVNFARFKNIVAEDALIKTNDKFTRRFQFIEAKAQLMNRNLHDMTLAEMDAIWNEAKAIEK